MLIGRQLGVATMAVTGVTRLPMVAGWDRLLPPWFSKLHPRYKTPMNSILFVNALIFIMALAGIAGVGHQEAFQILDSASNAFYGIAYLFLFAIPLWGLKSSKAPGFLAARRGVFRFRGYASVVRALGISDCAGGQPAFVWM